MKKYLLLSMGLILCFILCACGKSEAVKMLEAQIDSLGTATETSRTNILAIDSAYAGLTEKEQAKVSNYAQYLSFRDDFYRLFLAGEWFYAHPDFWAVLSNSNPQGFRLHSDGTWDSDACGLTEGTWTLTDGILTMTEGVQGYTFNRLEVIYDGSTVGLGHFMDDRNQMDFLRGSDYDAWLGEYFLVLDLETADLDQYLGFALREYQETDVWGDPTGNTYTDILLYNKMLDQGWLFLDTVGEFAIEVLCPAYQTTYRDLDSGYTNLQTTEAAAVTLQYDLFASPIIRSFSNEHQSWECNISPDALTFGRGKGKLVFVSSKYVTVTADENGSNSRKLVWDRQDCPMTYHSGTLLEDYPY